LAALADYGGELQVAELTRHFLIFLLYGPVETE